MQRRWYCDKSYIGKLDNNDGLSEIVMLLLM
jgi:hypothetical protein